MDRDVRRTFFDDIAQLLAPRLDSFAASPFVTQRHAQLSGVAPGVAKPSLGHGQGRLQVLESIVSRRAIVLQQRLVVAA